MFKHRLKYMQLSTSAQSELELRLTTPSSGADSLLSFVNTECVCVHDFFVIIFNKYSNIQYDGLYIIL